MTPPPVPEQGPDEVRRLIEDILDRQEFQPPEPSFVERAVDWVLRQLERLFGGGDGGGGSLEGGGGGSGGSSWFTIVVLVLAVALVVVVLRSLRGSGLRRRKKAGPDELDVDVDERRSPEAWDELARRLEGEGRWKDAMRARFGSLVERLVDRGLVADVPGRTSGEYRADVRSSLPEVAAAFAEAADLFDRAWYGDLPTGPPEAERFTRDAELVLAAGEAGR